MPGYWGPALALTLHGDVTVVWLDELRSVLGRAHPAQPITLAIDSAGGDLVAAYHALWRLDRHPGLVTTIAGPAAKVHSAAALVYASGRQRRAHVSATFLLHAIEHPPAERWTVEAHLAAATWLGARDREMFDLIALRCGRPRAALDPVIGERSFSALTAQDIGLVHEVEW